MAAPGRELPHPGLYPFQQSLIRRELPLGAAEQSVAQGELHRDSLHIFPAYRIIKGLQHQQNGAALIGLASGLVGGGDEGQCAVPVQYFVQLPELAIPVYQQNIRGESQPDGRQQTRNGVPAGYAECFRLR